MSVQGKKSTTVYIQVNSSFTEVDTGESLTIMRVLQFISDAFSNIMGHEGCVNEDYFFFATIISS